MKCVKIGLFLAVGFLSGLYGQSPVFYHYSTDEGLPSSEVYDIIQDRKGYMWIATDRGVSRYNGYTFQNFTTNDGLINNTVFFIYEDWKGRIWFIPITSELCYYEDGVIHPFPYNHILANKYNRFITTFEINGNESITLGIYSRGIFRIDKKGSIQQLNADCTAKRTFLAMEIMGELHIASCSNQSGSGSGEIATLIFSDGKRTKKTELDVIRNRQQNMTGIKRKNGSFIMYFPGYIVEVTKDLEIVPIKTEADGIRIYEDNDSCLWISFRDNGVRRYAPNQLFASTDFRTYLSRESVTSIWEDMEGGFWMSTLSNGIFYIPDIGYTTFSFSEKEIITAMDVGPELNSVVLGLSSGRVMIVKSDSVANFIKYPFKAIITISKIGEGYFISAGNLSMILDKNNKRHNLLMGYLKGVFFSGNRIISATNYAMHEVDLDKREFICKKNISVRGDIVFIDSKKNIWMGDHTGLYLYQDSTIVKFLPENSLLKERVSAISELPDGRILAATIGKGLAIINGEHVEQITMGDGLASNVINCMAVGNKAIWLGTNNGISVITLKADQMNIQNLNIDHGLPGNEILRIKLSGDYVWASTRKILFYFNVNSARVNRNSPSVYIHTIVTAGRSIAPESNAKINHDAFPLRISYTGISYRKKGKVVYKYRLKGLSDDWQYTRAPYVEFLSLPAGNYDFELYASNENGIWSQQPAVFHFQIIPPFWKTLWFFMIIALLALVLLFFIFFLRIKAIQRGNKLKMDLLSYRQIALTMQMNPHFIFNSLNSIQSFILTEDKKVAAKYISKFSKLMRLSLENSQKEFISISNEIEVLNLYLELEKFRFKQMFDFRMDVSKRILVNSTYIPSMLIQPFVENCVKHAFATPIGCVGQIKISLDLKEDMLVCIVEDNGVGIEQVQQTKNFIEHSSAGMMITQQRLQLISKSMGQSFHFKMIDKSKTYGETGTIITFAVPHYIKNDQSFDN
jgi:two-component sensor histidine kinase